MKSITHITESTIGLLEPGDHVRFCAEKDHRPDWHGPRTFEATVQRTIIRSIHGPRIITVEQIDDGDGSTENDFYLADDWTVEVIGNPHPGTQADPAPEPDIKRSEQFVDREKPISFNPDRGPILQSMDQLRGIYGEDAIAVLNSQEKIVFRMRGVERLLEMRRLGFVDAHPPVVVICGSTRFRGEMAEANRELTLAGCMVLAPGVFAHDGDEITEEQKAALDALHLRKIDLADQVVVVDPGGYVGESTAREIAYAEEHGTPVRRLSTEKS